MTSPKCIQWHRFVIVLTVAGLAATVGCSMARMDVPAAGAWQADEMRVIQKGKILAPGSLRFGPYDARDLHEGSTRNERTSIGNVFKRSKDQGFAFRLFNQEIPKQAIACRASRDSHGLENAVFDLKLMKSRLDLSCQIGQPTEGGAGWMQVQQHDKGWRGQVVVGGVRLQIESEHRLAGGATRFEPAGYKLYQDGRMVAAVQLINYKTVWLARDVAAEVRQVASLAAATLILFPGLSGLQNPDT
jgi:hypothetical protein